MVCGAAVPAPTPGAAVIGRLAGLAGRLPGGSDGLAVAIRMGALAIGVGQSIAIARAGGPELRGVTAVFNSSCSLIYLLASFGLAEQAVSMCRQRGDFGPLRAILRSAWVVYTLVAALVAVVFLWIDSNVSWLAIGALAFLIGNQCFTVIGAMRGSVANAVASAVQQSVLLVSVLGLAAADALDVPTIKAALVLSFLVPWPLYLVWSTASPAVSVRASLTDVLRSVRDGVSWQVARVLQVSVMLIDTILVGRHLGDADAGVYAVGFSLATMPLLVSTQLALSVYHRANVYDRHNLGPDLLKAGAGYAVAYAGVSVVGPFMVTYLYGPAFAGALPVLWLLGVAGVALSCVQVSFFFSRVYGRPWPSVAYSVVGPVVVVVGGQSAMDRFGINGMAALVSLACVLMAVPAVWLAFRDRPKGGGGAALVPGAAEVEEAETWQGRQFPEL